jgi:site-specific DNA-methyltransferase (adenine-specific)
VENKILNLIRMPELTLYNGDCLEIMKELPEKSVDLIICDLPYGCLHAGRKQDGNWYDRNQNGGEGCSWDIKIDLKAFWEQVRRIRKNEHTPTIHFCTTKFGYELIQSNEAEFRYDLVWDKQRGVSFLSANKMPMRSHEMIYVFSKAGAFYNRVDIKGDFKANCGDKGAKNCRQYGVDRGPPRPDNTGKRCALSVIQNPTSATRGGHPTEKPPALYRFLIERYCPPGGTVLDPTFGSGTSVFSAYEMGRNGIGIEKDDKFFEKAAKKLNDL